MMMKVHNCKMAPVFASVNESIPHASWLGIMHFCYVLVRLLIYYKRGCNLLGDFVGWQMYL